jgi:hypothetical protein
LPKVKTKNLSYLSTILFLLKWKVLKLNSIESNNDKPKESVIFRCLSVQVESRQHFFRHQEHLCVIDRVCSKRTRPFLVLTYLAIYK